VLERTEIAGSVTNASFLAALARDVDFAAGDVDTGLIARKQEALTAVSPTSLETIAQAALAASGMGNATASSDPWNALAGYAHFHAGARRTVLRRGEEEIIARISVRPDGRFDVALDGAEPSGHSVAISSSKGENTRVARWPGHVTIFEGAASYTFAIQDPFAKAADAEAGVASMRAPMPGLVKVVKAASGETVRKGQPLLILEAMKMEHTVAAPHDGIIAEIATEGAQVTDGTVLVRFEEAV
jgi:3-methylcrotonyl-CoA carboxylase alpha subunit